MAAFCRTRLMNPCVWPPDRDDYSVVWFFRKPLRFEESCFGNEKQWRASLLILPLSLWPVFQAPAVACHTH